MKEAKEDWAKKWISTAQKSYINGEWVEGSSDKQFETLDPSCGEKLGTFKVASADDVKRAAAAGRKALKSRQWQKMETRERARLLQSVGQLIRDHVDELATLECLPNGKLYSEAYYDDMPDSADVFDYYAGWIDKIYGELCPVEEGFLNYTTREPVGVCGLIVPWNFPLLMACWKIAPALACGNPIIVKPSEYTPYSVLRLMELIDQKLDFPDGMISVLLGDGSTGQAISESMDIDKISFTGSTAVGKKILSSAAATNLKKVTLELGGKSPNILFADLPDLDFAIERSFQVMFSQKGEKCSEPTRILIEKKIYENVVSKIGELADAMICGHQFDVLATQGAQCNKAQYEKVLHYIDVGKQSGARLVAGGEVDQSPALESGYFVRPTLFADVDNKSQVAQDEIFGPILVATPFDKEEQAVEMANDTTYGLAAGLWTSDASRAHRVASQLEAGMVFINKYGCYHFSSPFGGFKQSGWGKEMGLQSIHSYTKSKAIWQKL